MKDIEELLKEAAAPEIQSVTRESLPPLALPARVARRRPQWLVPIAAVVAVATVVAVTVTLGDFVRDRTRTHALSGGDAPRFYVSAMRTVAVHDARTGKAVEGIDPSRADESQGLAVAAAGDGRTFFMAVGEGRCEARLEEITLGPDGKVAATRLVAGEIKAEVGTGSIAATADGRRVAVASGLYADRADDTRGCGGEGNGLVVVDTGSGSQRSWRIAANGQPIGRTEIIPHHPVWSGDGRTLYFLDGQAIRTLDTAKAGTDLAASQTLVKGFDGFDVRSFAIDPSSGTIVALVEDRSAEDPENDPQYSVEEISTTGRRVGIGIFLGPASWAVAGFDRTGRHVLVARAGDGVVRIDGRTIHRLPEGDNGFAELAW